jgi:hypothetical protein
LSLPVEKKRRREPPHFGAAPLASISAGADRSLLLA